MKSLESKIRERLTRLWPQNSGNLLLAAVSGGADSLAMLHALSNGALPAGMRLAVAHLNHGIRPDAADDATFVQQVCDQLDIPFYVATVDVPTRAASAGISLEMAAREARYRFFAQVAGNIGARAVATAHTMDDQAETVLLKLARGTGAAGLCGIAELSTIKGLTVIRPMLTICRAEIVEYLKSRELRWHEDSTNGDINFRRNAIRHIIIPELEQHLNPRAKEAIVRTATILRDDEACLDTIARKSFNQISGPSSPTLAVAAFRELTPAIQRRVLHIWLIANGMVAGNLTFELIERLRQLALCASGGGAIRLDASREIRHEYEILRLVSTRTDVSGIAPTEIKVPGTTFLPQCGLKISTQLCHGFERKQPEGIGQYPATATIRFEVAENIRVRSRQPGDNIRPIGMDGCRKVQDILTDAKIPGALRDCIPIFEIDGRIVWIAGYRISADRAVANANQPALKLEVSRLRDETEDCP